MLRMAPGTKKLFPQIFVKYIKQHEEEVISILQIGILRLGERTWPDLSLFVHFILSLFRLAISVLLQNACMHIIVKYHHSLG